MQAPFTGLTNESRYVRYVYVMRRQELHPHTAVINRAQKIHSKKTRLEALQWLSMKFPKAFDNSLKIQPLKIGIMTDILSYSEEAQRAGFSKSKLREAVVVFTRRIDYLTCLKARNQRIDLEGNPVALVTEEEALKATHKIKKRIEKSMRNARKTGTKKIGSSGTGITANWTVPLSPLTDPHQFERKPLYSMPEPQSQARSPVIKHKSARPFDPDAVARIKQRLGLKQKKEEIMD